MSDMLKKCRRKFSPHVNIENTFRLVTIMHPKTSPQSIARFAAFFEASIYASNIVTVTTCIEQMIRSPLSTAGLTTNGFHGVVQQRARSSPLPVSLLLRGTEAEAVEVVQSDCEGQTRRGGQPCRDPRVPRSVQPSIRLRSGSGSFLRLAPRSGPTSPPTIWHSRRAWCRVRGNGARSSRQ